jgi:hypothetical protein
MKIPNVNYPIAMIVIIILAVFVMYGGFIKPQQVNLAKYQELCTQYLQAPAGAYKHDQMQLLVEKINYLFPTPAKDLSQPAERELKTCSDRLTEKLKSAQK